MADIQLNLLGNVNSLNVGVVTTFGTFENHKKHVLLWSDINRMYQQNNYIEYDHLASTTLFGCGKHVSVIISSQSDNGINLSADEIEKQLILTYTKS